MTAAGKSSSFIVIVVGLIAILAASKWGHSVGKAPEACPFVVLPDGVVGTFLSRIGMPLWCTFSLEELRQHDGSNPEKPIFLAIGGYVFDVSSGKEFRDEYRTFAGRDVTRAVALGIEVGCGNSGVCSRRLHRIRHDMICTVTGHLLGCVQLPCSDGGLICVCNNMR
jgi:predicted heme/steroid binding protein